MKTVYGYLRVSTAKQGEGVSLIAQKEAIERYAVQYNLEIIQWFEEKETAAKQGRPIFTTMMKQLQAGQADGVIIHKIDRSARNLKDWADLGTLIDKGVEIHFAHESLDLQARGGRLSADIQAVIAADYIRNLRQEAIKGIYGRLKQGIYPFQAPTGYLNTGKGKVKTIDPVQSEYVRKAFELYASKKYTLHTLAPYMEQLGLKNIKQRRVNINSLSVILNNPFYMGIIKVKGMSFNGGHEPIITPDLFKRVQLILRGNTNQKIKKHDFRFKKSIVCLKCGYSLIAEIQKGITYYRCHTKACTTRGLRETTIENFLFKAFVTAELYPEESAMLEEILIQTEKQWVDKQEELLATIRMQEGQIQEKIERLTDCYVEGGIDKNIYEQRKAKLLVECKTKQVAEKNILSEKGRIFSRVKKFLELAKDLVGAYKNGFLEEQRELVQILTSNLEVAEKKLIITMRSPFFELSQRHNLYFGEPQRGTRRIDNVKIAKSATDEPQRYTARQMNTKLVYSDINTSPIRGAPLSKEALEILFQQILDVCSNMDTKDDDP